MHDLARVRAALAASDAVTLRPPATEADLAAFETRHRIALPAAYRTFAAAVCDGLLVDGEPMLYSLAEIEADLVANHADPTAPFPYDAPETMAVYQVSDDATTPLDFLAWLAAWAPCMLGVDVGD